MDTPDFQLINLKKPKWRFLLILHQNPNSVKIDSYIQQLLLDHEMVIVPGFGAFISEYQPAQLDNESDEIKPPSTRTVFNPQIKNNDGLLVGYVAEATRSSHFEALQKIEKERDNILYQLDKGEKVELLDLGVLYYDQQNELVFISEKDKSHSLESFGLGATSLKEPEIEEPAEPEAVAEEEQTEDAPPVVVPVEPEMDEPEISEKPPQEEEQSQEEKQPAEESVEELEEQEESQPEEEEIAGEEPIEEKEEEEIVAVVPPVTEAPVAEKEEKKRKGGWIWLLVILIPLIAVSVFILMKDKTPEKQVEKETVVNTPEEKSEPVAVIDSTISDSTQIEVSDSISQAEELPKQEPVVEETGPKFYLIGGSFKAEENAETYLQTLKADGYEPFHLGKYGSFYIVGIGKYDTEDEALSAKNEFLDKNPDSGIWILEK